MERAQQDEGGAWRNASTFDQLEATVMREGVLLRWGDFEGDDETLRIDYAELEAMRLDALPSRSARPWVKVLDLDPDGRRVVYWRMEEEAIDIAADDVRQWLREASERGYWDAGQRAQVTARTLWRRLDESLSGALKLIAPVGDTMLDVLTDWLVARRGGRGRIGSMVQKPPATPAQPFYAPARDPKAEVLLVQTLAGIAAGSFNATRGVAVLREALGRERFRRLVALHRNEDVVANTAVCRAFWAACVVEFAVN